MNDTSRVRLISSLAGSTRMSENSTASSRFILISEIPGADPEQNLSDF